MSRLDAGDEAHMLICAVRYALGRSSYVVGEAAQWVRTMWPDIQHERAVIERDVRDFVDRTGQYRGCSFGYSYDERVWSELLGWIKNQAPYQKPTE